MAWKALSMALGVASLCLIMGAASAPLAAERQPEGYASLRGVTNVKSVFDFRIADPKSAALHLSVIRRTCADQALVTRKQKPVFALVFSGLSVKLLSQKRDGLTPEEAKLRDEIAQHVTALAKDGVRLEVCQIALSLLGVDTATILPELHMVGNGYVALIGYGKQGYVSVPVY